MLERLLSDHTYLEVCSLRFPFLKSIGEMGASHSATSAEQFLDAVGHNKYQDVQVFMFAILRCCYGTFRAASRARDVRCARGFASEKTFPTV